MAKTCLLGGLFVYDTIIQREYTNGFVPGKRNKFIDKVIHECVGGTCGNVSTMLPYLGVQSYPIAHFDLSDQGRALTADLKYYGADTRFVRNTPKGGTTILNCVHKLDDKTGEHAMGFHAFSPSSNFAQHKFIKFKDEVPALLEKLDFVPDVYFFDVPEAGNRALAEELKKKGSLVYFEPEGVSDKKKFDKAVAVSDIVKFSGTKVTDLSFIRDFSEKLFVKTMGDAGLDFKLGLGEWQHVDSPKVDDVVDWEGAGDWLTSKFIALLCENALLEVSSFTEDFIRNLLAEACKTAARSVSFMSSKGMIDAEKGRRPRVQIADEDVPTRGIIGTICGDIIGSTYESKTKWTKDPHITVFRSGSLFTDDTTMTLAIARWLCGDRTLERLEACMVDFAPMCTIYRYGHKFRDWLKADVRAPYGAASNGSAMRVAAVGWVANSLDECLDLAKQTADITHNSEGGERGAMSVAAAVYLARTGKSKNEIKQFIEERFGYNLSRSIEEIRETYAFTSMADESVPEAIVCWLQSSTYMEAISNAIALGGDADTQAAIAGAISAATPGMEVPKEVAVKAVSYLTDSLKEAFAEFENYIKK